jgi:membrane protease YdiL (CAAX protease family)
MRSYLRVHSAWSQLAIFILLLAGAFFVTFIISIVILISKGIVVTDIRNLNFNDAKIVNTLKLVQGISTITIFLLPAVAFSMIAYRFRQFYFLGFRKQGKSSFYILAVVIILCCFPFVGWLGVLNEHIHLAKWMMESEKEASKQMEAFLKVNDTSDIIINLVLVALLPAVCEEIFFRGCLQRILIYAFKSPWAGIIVTAAMFSAFHMQFEGFLPRMFLGILLGAIFWYSNSLWPNIFAHFFNNAIQVIAVLYYPKLMDQNPSVPFLAALVSGALVFGLLYILRKQSTVTYAKMYDMEKVNEYNQFLA